MHRRSGTTARGGAPRTSIRGQRKSDQPTKKSPRAVIGVSAIPLSSRFTHLTEMPAPRQSQQHQVTVVKVQKKKKPVLRAVAPKKKTATVTKKQIQQQQQQQQQRQKLQQVAQANRSKRQQVVDKRRKGLGQQDAKPKATGKPGKAKAAPAAQNGGRGGGRGASTRGRGGGRGGRGGRGEKKPKPVTGEDLDMDMDSYWHEAGKGPDPKAVQLDRQMEEYWAAKPTQEDEAKAEGDAAPDASMES